MCTFQIPSTFFIAMLDVSLQPYPSILGLPTLLLFPFIPCLQPRVKKTKKKSVAARASSIIGCPSFIFFFFRGSYP
ncbi:hypothetical protein VIGAN_UM006400 [Vigna angularis var. angularis]|uniref:Uncharacterized protein n=1 Tax=Vigna angularis var. angularis TaxID=157739 RepID=A0A0S3TDC8_PHAAN|nr:hypothetical protein VIGAN_UM006400 [Vigna angularis var. angularis]